MSVTDREQGSTADIRELRELARDIVGRVGNMEMQMRVMLALMTLLLVIAVLILIRVW